MPNSDPHPGARLRVSAESGKQTQNADGQGQGAAAEEERGRFPESSAALCGFITVPRRALAEGVSGPCCCLWLLYNCSLPMPGIGPEH